MTEQEMIALAKQELEAFNIGDWDRQAALHAPDAVYEEPATHRRVQGSAAIIAALKQWREAYPDLRATVQRAFVSGDTVILEMTWTGTQTGPLAGPFGVIPPSGKAGDPLPAVEFFVIKDGRVAEMRHYFDLFTVLQSIGAIPTAAAVR